MSSVVVFGSLNMDLAIESARMPQQGETIPGWGFFVNAGGKGANQAVAAAKFGVPTYLIGATGRDAFGEQIIAGLEGYGVRCEEVSRVEGVETGVAIVLRSGGDNRIVLSPGANHALGIDEVNASLDRVARPGDVFHGGKPDALLSVGDQPDGGARLRAGQPYLGSLLSDEAVGGADPFQPEPGG